MKILAIIASPRGMQGNTGRLLDMQDQWPFENEFRAQKRRLP